VEGGDDDPRMTRRSPWSSWSCHVSDTVSIRPSACPIRKRKIQLFFFFHSSFFFCRFLFVWSVYNLRREARPACWEEEDDALGRRGTRDEAKPPKERERYTLPRDVRAGWKAGAARGRRRGSMGFMRDGGEGLVGDEHRDETGDARSGVDRMDQEDGLERVELDDWLPEEDVPTDDEDDEEEEEEEADARDKPSMSMENPERSTSSSKDSRVYMDEASLSEPSRDSLAVGSCPAMMVHQSISARTCLPRTRPDGSVLRRAFCMASGVTGYGETLSCAGLDTTRRGVCTGGIEGGAVGLVVARSV